MNVSNAIYVNNYIRISDTTIFLNFLLIGLLKFHMQTEQDILTRGLKLLKMKFYNLQKITGNNGFKRLCNQPTCIHVNFESDNFAVKNVKGQFSLCGNSYFLEKKAQFTLIFMKQFSITKLRRKLIIWVDSNLVNIIQVFRKTLLNYSNAKIML